MLNGVSCFFHGEWKHYIQAPSKGWLNRAVVSFCLSSTTSALMQGSASLNWMTGATAAIMTLVDSCSQPIFRKLFADNVTQEIVKQLVFSTVGRIIVTTIADGPSFWRLFSVVWPGGLLSIAGTWWMNERNLPGAPQIYWLNPAL